MNNDYKLLKKGGKVKLKQKQKQIQTQKVIVNIGQIKTKARRTKRKAVIKNEKKQEQRQTNLSMSMPRQATFSSSAIPYITGGFQSSQIPLRGGLIQQQLIDQEIKNQHKSGTVTDNIIPIQKEFSELERQLEDAGRLSQSQYDRQEEEKHKELIDAKSDFSYQRIPEFPNVPPPPPPEYKRGRGRPPKEAGEPKSKYVKKSKKNP
jgi:hypothetical protein